jgi:hypothetical protein
MKKDYIQICIRSYSTYSTQLEFCSAIEESGKRTLLEWCALFKLYSNVLWLQKDQSSGIPYKSYCKVESFPGKRIKSLWTSSVILIQATWNLRERLLIWRGREISYLPFSLLSTRNTLWTYHTLSILRYVGIAPTRSSPQREG